MEVSRNNARKACGLGVTKYATSAGALRSQGLSCTSHMHPVSHTSQARDAQKPSDPTVTKWLGSAALRYSAISHTQPCAQVDQCNLSLPHPPPPPANAQGLVHTGVSSFTAAALWACMQWLAHAWYGCRQQQRAHREGVRAADVAGSLQRDPLALRRQDLREAVAARLVDQVPAEQRRVVLVPPPWGTQSPV